MTRVLVVNLYYPPHHMGGYELSCSDVVERLAARGHDVAVLTSSLRSPERADPPDERTGQVPVWRDLVPYLVRDGELWDAGPLAARRVEKRNRSVLREALDTHQPDVVGVWQLGALSLGIVDEVVRRGLPLVYAVCDDWPSYAPVLDRWERFLGRLPAPARQVVARAAGVPGRVDDVGATGPMLFVSETTRERTARYATWTAERSAVVHSGIDTTLFTAGPTSDHVHWNGHLLYAGRYDPRKGIETVLRALPVVDATLEIRATGDDGERTRLQDLAHRLDVADRVTFGCCTRDELVDRYRAADAVVFPSEWDEPFGLVPLEAMACGTPVIATGTGGSDRFLLDGVNCVRFEPGDPAGLASAVRRLAGDSHLRRRLVEHGSRTASFFDVERLTDTFEAWYVAAASGFVEGEPVERVFSLDSVLEDVGG